MQVHVKNCSDEEIASVFGIRVVEVGEVLHWSAKLIAESEIRWRNQRGCIDGHYFSFEANPLI